MNISLVSDFMQITTGIAALVIAYFVYQHGRRRDREDIVERSWSAQQQLNLATITSRKTQIAYDCLVNGKLHSDDEINHQIVFISFMLLNRVQLIWNGCNAGLFSSAELKKETIPTITLVSKHRELLEYCLTRGYDEKYAEYVLSKIPDTEARGSEIVDVTTFLNSINRENES